MTRSVNPKPKGRNPGLRYHQVEHSRWVHEQIWAEYPNLRHRASLKKSGSPIGRPFFGVFISSNFPNPWQNTGKSRPSLGKFMVSCIFSGFFFPNDQPRFFFTAGSFVDLAHQEVMFQGIEFPNAGSKWNHHKQTNK